MNHKKMAAHHAKLNKHLMAAGDQMHKAADIHGMLSTEHQIEANQPNESEEQDEVEGGQGSSVEKENGTPGRPPKKSGFSHVGY